MPKHAKRSLAEQTLSPLRCRHFMILPLCSLVLGTGMGGKDSEALRSWRHRPSKVRLATPLT